MKILKTLVGLILGCTITSSYAVVLETCSWDKPGVNPYTGNIASAIDHYRDIAPEIREKFKQRIIDKKYDDLVTISRDQITSPSHSYESQITDMHFGGKTSKSQLCLATSRSKWSPRHTEIGLVYCEGQTCILVPTICNNISRIKRLPESAITTGSRKAGGTTEAQTPAQAEATPTDEGGGGGGGGGALPSTVKSGAIVESSAVSHNGGGSFPAFQPYTGPFGGDGGGGCCYVGPTEPKPPVVVPPIVNPPIVVPPIINPPVIPAVPEPSSLLMFLFGLCIMLVFSILKNKK